MQNYNKNNKEIDNNIGQSDHQQNNVRGDFTIFDLADFRNVSNDLNYYKNYGLDRDISKTSLGKAIRMEKKKKYDLEKIAFSKVNEIVEKIETSFVKEGASKSDEKNAKERIAKFNKSSSNFHSNIGLLSNSKLSSNPHDHNYSSLMGTISKIDDSIAKMIEANLQPHNEIIAFIEERARDLEEYFSTIDKYCARLKNIINPRQDDYEEKEVIESTEQSKESQIIENFKNFYYEKFNHKKLDEDSVKVLEGDIQSIKEIAARKYKEARELELATLDMYKLQLAQAIKRSEIETKLNSSLQQMRKKSFGDDVFLALDEIESIVTSAEFIDKSDNESIKNAINELRKIFLKEKIEFIVNSLKNTSRMTINESELVTYGYHLGDMLEEYTPKLSELRIEGDLQDMNRSEVLPLHKTLAMLNLKLKKQLKIDVKDSELNKFFEYNGLYRQYNEKKLTVDQILELFDKRLLLLGKVSSNDSENQYEQYYHSTVSTIVLPTNDMTFVDDDSKKMLKDLFLKYNSLKSIDLTANKDTETLEAVLDCLKDNVKVIISEEYRKTMLFDKREFTKAEYKELKLMAMDKRVAAASKISEEWNRYKKNKKNKILDTNDTQVGLNKSQETKKVIDQFQKNDNSIEHKAAKMYYSSDDEEVVDTSKQSTNQPRKDNINTQDMDSARTSRSSDDEEQMSYTSDSISNRSNEVNQDDEHEDLSFYQDELLERKNTTLKKSAWLSEFRSEMRSKIIDILQKAGQGILPNGNAYYQNFQEADNSEKISIYKEILDEKKLLEPFLYDYVMYKRTTLGLLKFDGKNYINEIANAVKSGFACSDSTIIELVDDEQLSSFLQKGVAGRDINEKMTEKSMKVGVKKVSYILQKRLELLDKYFSNISQYKSIRHLLNDARELSNNLNLRSKRELKDFYQVLDELQTKINNSHSKMEQIGSENMILLEREKFSINPNIYFEDLKGTIEEFLDTDAIEKSRATYLQGTRYVLESGLRNNVKFEQSLDNIIKKSKEERHSTIFSTILEKKDVQYALSQLKLLCESVKDFDNINSLELSYKKKLLEARIFQTLISNTLISDTSNNKPIENRHKLDFSKVVQLAGLNRAMSSMNNEVYHNLDDNKFPYLKKLRKIYHKSREAEDNILTEYKNYGNIGLCCALDNDNKLEYRKLDLLDVLRSDVYKIDILKLLKDEARGKISNLQEILKKYSQAAY